jgi:hypothetical protein
MNGIAYVKRTPNSRQTGVRDGNVFGQFADPRSMR